jgi:hypothetical protein
MPAHNASILFIGQADHRELHGIHRALSAAARRYHQVRQLDQAIAWLRRARWLPDVAVVAPLWPGQFDAQDVAHLVGRCPLARVIWCLGSWCQAGGRGAVRGIAHVCVAHPSAVLRLLDDLQLLEQATLPPLGLPPTASAEEQLERALQTAGVAGPPRGTLPRNDPIAATAAATPTAHPALQSVAVCCSDPEFASVLAETCEQRSRRVFVAPFDTLRRMPTDCLVWDSTPWSDRRIDQLRAYRAAHPRVPVLAITDFPRYAICSALMDHGATTILTKPLLITDLLRRLDQPNGSLDPHWQK